MRPVLASHQRAAAMMRRCLVGVMLAAASPKRLEDEGVAILTDQIYFAAAATHLTRQRDQPLTREKTRGKLLGRVTPSLRVLPATVENAASSCSENVFHARTRKFSFQYAVIVCGRHADR